MKRIRQIILESVALLCTVIVLVIAADSLMEVNSRAEVLTLLFGSFGAGALLVNLVKDIRKLK